MDLDLLKYEALMGMINEFEQEDLILLNSGICPDESQLGQSFAWDILGIPRDISKFQSKHSSSEERQLVVIDQQSARPATTFLRKMLQASAWQDLRQPGTSIRQEAAQQQIPIELKDMDDAIDRQDEFMIAGALQGELNITIHDVDVSVDYGIPDGNIFGIAEAGDQKIETDWADPSADFKGDIRRLKKASRQASGRKPARAYCSELIIELISKGDQFQEAFGSTESGAAALREGSIGRFCGLDWFPLDGTYLDGEDVKLFWPEQLVVVTPNPDRKMLSMLRGGQMIPGADGKSLREVLGRAPWASLTMDPPALQLFLRDVRIPALKIPGAISRALVTA